MTGARDRLSWREAKDGRFSVRSAYAFLIKDIVPRPNMEDLYKRVWRVMAPERVRVFLWLVTLQVIMTNMERQRRHLSDNGICQLCKGGDESILHALRDCPAAEGLWKKIVNPSRQQRFFNQTLFEWLYENLANVSANGDQWPSLFALTVWWCWKWRCGYVFGDTGKCRDRVNFVKDKAQEVIQANKNLRVQSTCGVRVERQSLWYRPRNGWVKLNTDGASRGNPGRAAASGVLRDEFGGWTGGVCTKYWYLFGSIGRIVGCILWAMHSLG